MKPQEYSFKLNEQWRFIEELEDHSEDFDKEKYEMYIEIEGHNTIIEWFPNSNGMKVETPVSVDGEDSKQYGIFGLVCMRLMLTGSNWMKEL